MHIQVFETRLFQELRDILLDSDRDTLILLDIDDTIITPRANIFRYKNNEHYPFIDELKKNKAQIPNFIELLSHWRLKRKSILVHENWPNVIQELKKKMHVFGLTQMETGSFGHIPSMEEWRYHELQEKEIIFTDCFQDKILIKNDLGYSIFYKGIMMTGPFSKAEVLKEMLKGLAPKKIIFVDDRIEQIQDLASLAKEEKIGYLGIHYRGFEDVSGEVNHKIAKLQKKYFLEEGKWLEDDEIMPGR